jgi:hypothetical protein
MLLSHLSQPYFLPSLTPADNRRRSLPKRLACRCARPGYARLLGDDEGQKPFPIEEGVGDPIQNKTNSEIGGGVMFLRWIHSRGRCLFFSFACLSDMGRAGSTMRLSQGPRDKRGLGLMTCRRRVASTFPLPIISQGKSGLWARGYASLASMSLDDSINKAQFCWRIAGCSDPLSDAEWYRARGLGGAGSQDCIDEIGSLPRC